MDEGELGKAIGRLEAGQEQQRELSQAILERLDQIPVRCADHQRECRAAVDRAIDEESDTRQRQVGAAFAQLNAHAAHLRPTTVGDVLGWAWRLGAGVAAVSAGSLAVHALILAVRR